MANTYYDSELTAEEIEEVLEAIKGILTQANNGKVLAISNGKIEARSVQWGGGEAVLEPLSVTENGDYTPEAGVDGFDEVHVSVPNSYSASDEGKVVSNGALVAQTARASQITQNGTYDTTLNNEVTVNVSGGGSAVIQSLSVTENGTYTAPAGVDGYSPVVVNVSGGGGETQYVAYRVLSVSTSGSNASVSVQKGIYDFNELTPFAPTEDPVTYEFRGSTYTENHIDNIFSLDSYVNNSWNWGVQGISGHTIYVLNEGVYAPGVRAKVWYYSTSVDFYIVTGIDSRSAVVQPLSVTQNGIYNPPSGVDGYAPVLVNVSGGGSIEEWNFKESFIGEERGTEISATNVVRDSSGAIFDNTTDYLSIPLRLQTLTIEIDVGAMNLQSGAHRRFVMRNVGEGLIYRSNGKWSFYANNSWAIDSDISDGDFFENSTIKIVVDSSYYWHIYKDNVLVYEPSRPLELSNANFTIGAEQNSINNAVIEGLRIL